MIAIKWQLALLFQSFLTVMIAYFKNQPEDFVSILTAFIQSSKKHLLFVYQMVQDASSSFNNHMMLFKKDRNFISDNNYFCFYHSLFLNWLFPSKTEIQRLRSKLNKYLMENWQVKEVWDVDGEHIGWKCSLLFVVKEMMRVQARYSSVPSRISIVLSGDGRSKHGGQNIFAVKPIGLSQFDIQSGPQWTILHTSCR